MNTAAIDTPSAMTIGTPFPIGQGPGQDMRAAMTGLRDALNARNVEGARAAYEAVTTLVEARETATGRETPTGLSETLSAVGSALESGNVDEARSALANGRPQGPEAVPPPGGRPGGSQLGGPSAEVREAIGALSAALSSDNVSEAQSANEAVLSALEDQEDGVDTDGTQALLDAFTERLDDLGGNLNAGNMDGARSVFAQAVQPGLQGINLMV